MPRSADLNADGIVESGDLSHLLLEWGPQSGPADLNADRSVDGGDISDMMLRWGERG